MPSEITLTQTYPTLWTYFSSRIINHKTSVKVAGFDLDSTLINVKSGAKFAKDADDWVWLSPLVPTKLKELREIGFLIIVFTNQKGIKNGSVDPIVLGQKLTKMTVDASFDLFDAILVAGDEDQYRKPHVGMWTHLEGLLGLNLASSDGSVGSAGSAGSTVSSVDLSSSFYCGDAAGRPKNWRPKAIKDFSISDRFFAHNIGLSFRVPEEMFADQKMAIDFSSIPYDDPYQSSPDLQILKDVVSCDINDHNYIANSDKILKFDPNIQHMILMVGAPASGKSSLATRICSKYGFVYINQDVLKTKAKCLKEVRLAISQSKSVVIDNTNPTKVARAEFLSLITGQNYQIKAIVMNTPKLLCQHLNQVRMAIDPTRRVPMIAYNLFYSKYQAPELGEGFTQIFQMYFRMNLPIPKEMLGKYDL